MEDMESGEYVPKCLGLRELAGLVATIDMDALPERPLGLSNIPGRMFANLTTDVGDYVDPSELSDEERLIVRSAFGQQFNFSIRASLRPDGRYVRRAKDYAGDGTELWRAEYVALAAFRVQPRGSVYFKSHDATPFVAFETLRAFGCVPDVAAFRAEEVAWATVKAVVGSRTVIQPRAPEFTHAWNFVTLAAAARTYPSARGALLGLAAPTAVQPKLPMYEVAELEGTWVTSADFVRVVLELMPDMAPDGLGEEALMEAWDIRVRYARVTADGSLAQCTKNKAESTPVIATSWLSAKRQEVFSPVLGALGPANMDVPIVTGVHPARNGVRARKAEESKREGALRNPRQSSVKMTLGRRLKDPAMVALLEDVVDSVSCASRYGSYLLNLHLMRVMDLSRGVLPDGGRDVFTLEDTVRKAMAAVRYPVPKHRGLAQTAEECPELMSLMDPTLQETGNALTCDAKQYATNVLTTMQLAGPNRVKGLLNAACKLYSVRDKSAAYSLSLYVKGCGALREGLPPAVTDLAIKYRTAYAEKGLHDEHGFRIHDIHSPPVRQERVRRVLELYWMINQDLAALEAVALRSGWTAPAAHDNLGGTRPSKMEMFEDPDGAETVVDEKSRVWSRGAFAFLPISSLKRRHVRIDNASFQRALERGSAVVDDTLHDGVSFASMFVEKGFRRQDIRRIKAQGSWEMAPSFQTDGRSLVVTYLSKLESGPPKRRAAKKAEAQPIEIPPGAIVVGDDPGRKNTSSTCQRVADGEVASSAYQCTRVRDGEGWLEFKTLTRGDHYEHLDPVTRRAEARHALRASEAIAALSSTRRRTARLSEFRSYVAAMAAGKDQLKAAYGCRAACSEAFSNYRSKTKKQDKFIASFLGDQSYGSEEKGRVFYARGMGGFDPTGPGERSVPTTSFDRRIDTAFKASMTRVPVDEWNTTAMCSVTHTELAPAWRPLTTASGQLRYVKDRDVRFCTSELLGSPHPCAASSTLLEGLLRAPAGAVGVDRDRNAAFAILKLAGLRNEDRPAVYRRPIHD